MNETLTKIINATNEPIKPYGPGSREKESIKTRIKTLKIYSGRNSHYNQWRRN